MSSFVGLARARRVLCVLQGFLFVFVAVSTVVDADTASPQVAVVVHRNNELSNLSSSDLERTFLLRQQRWSTGRRIYLLMREEGSVIKEIVLEKVYRMTSDQLKRFWQQAAQRDISFGPPADFARPP